MLKTQIFCERETGNWTYHITYHHSKHGMGLLVGGLKYSRLPDTIQQPISRDECTRLAREHRKLIRDSIHRNPDLYKPTEEK